jgi:SAM-dependent methyltransferase
MKLLLVPAIGAGIGSGHLRRCLTLARRWGAEAALLLEDCRSRSGRGAEELVALLDSGQPRPRLLESFDPRETWDLVLLDNFRTEPAALARFARLPVIGLDEGGTARGLFPYLVDTPLAGSSGHPPNLASSAILELPPRRAAWQHPFRRVLLSFGGEDAADLSGRLLARLLGRGVFRAEELTVVQGPCFSRGWWPEGVTVLVNPPLRSVLAGYDLVFTSFGLTSMEALAAGVPVISFNPTRYHRRLARAAGLPEIGVRRPSWRRLRGLLADRGIFERLLEAAPSPAIADAEADGLERLPPTELLPALMPAGAAACPICGQTLNPAVARFPRRSYFRCRSCRILYLAGFGVEAKQYGESYFFEEYRRQYGRTYLEDFPAIKAAGSRRLGNLLRLLPRGGAARLLDVGCAYGPFLQAAREAGLEAEGLDVSGEAVCYVRETLGIPCAQGDFLKAPLPLQPYDALTLWYVVEHFRDAGGALAKANRLLRPGGVLGLATPSAAGISARRSLRGFLRSSPADHFTVWSPKLAGPLLRRFGFRLRLLRVTGHHPERFPTGLPAAALASRLLGLGDTFEAYAVKSGEPS